MFGNTKNSPPANAIVPGRVSSNADLRRVKDMLNSGALRKEIARTECKEIGKVIDALVDFSDNSAKTVGLLMGMVADYDSVIQKMKGIMSQSAKSNAISPKDYEALNRLTSTKLGEFERSLSDQAKKLESVFARYGAKSVSNSLSKSLESLRRTSTTADSTIGYLSGGKPKSKKPIRKRV